ncbi:MAG: threonine--tRNA ligase [Oscillospiraceae bacterium]|nr:threonine--tRNA ligase [Oscillospiraceae bacterium]
MKVIHSDGSIGCCEGEEQLQVLRHSAAHLLAQAILRLWPDASIAGSGVSTDGFYCDADPGSAVIRESDLVRIEEEIRSIAGENLPFRPFALPVQEAWSLLAQHSGTYLPPELSSANGTVTLFRQGEHIELCSGPHIACTKALKAFRLTGLSGAYWQNDSSNKMLARISGTAFVSVAELDAFLEARKAAALRDHRRIGREMGLFQLFDEGTGFPFLLPNGVTLRNTLLDYWRALHRQNGYREISTPIVLHKSLWQTSGHWEHYRETMYTTLIDGEDHCIKPMSCPGGILIYRSRPHSYRELPIRLAELGLVHRNELRGTLHGLFRVRCFTQDDAHIFMRRDQIADELAAVIRLIHQVYADFGFPCRLELSTRPENSMGSDEDWQLATDGLRSALDAQGLAYEINEGDGAFYGPKIDFHLQDSLGRSWQCGTVQLDFQLPQNFGLSYVDEQGLPQQPIMLHRVCFGSVERFIGILTEHYAGRFPLWLAPVQAKVLTVSEKSAGYARLVYETLCRAGIRCEIDTRNEKIGYMIRESQFAERIPCMLIVGEKEMQNGTVSLRSRDDGSIGEMTPEELIRYIRSAGAIPHMQA